MIKRVYLDYAATTPLSDSAYAAMLPYFTERFGNADSLHAFGAAAALGLDHARREIAEILNARKNEIYFTSGGTEANNWAVKGTARANRGKGNHIIISNIEHASVMQSAEQLRGEGFLVTQLPANGNGLIDPALLAANITDETCLISIMTANNEIGTVQPVKELAAVAKKHNIPFHTDAVQAAGTLELDVRELGADLLTISAHKFYGPKGVGVLYIKKDLKPQPFPLIVGGQQEREMRGGTSNAALAAGMAAAFCEANKELKENYALVMKLRDYFVSKIESEIPFVRYNGDRVKRLPQNANFSFEGLKAGELIPALDLAGVACASGSACSSGSVEPSHVLLALGAGEELAASAVRFSLGKSTTRGEIDYAVGQIKKTVEKFRKPLPLFKEIKSKTEKV